MLQEFPGLYNLQEANTANPRSKKSCVLDFEVDGMPLPVCHHAHAAMA